MAVVTDEPTGQPASPYNYPQTQTPNSNFAPPAGYSQNYNANYHSVPPQGYGPPVGQPVQMPTAQVANLPPPGPLPEKEDLFKPARIVAIVNGEPILAGDVLGPINKMINERLEMLTAEQRASVSEEDLDKFKEQALKQMLPGMIDVKVIFLDFMRAVPAKRKDEMAKMLDKNYDKYQLPEDLKNAGVTTAAELDIKLRENGGSLAKKRRQFVEQLVAHQQIRKHVKQDEEVTHLQMLDYYNDHADVYKQLAKAKWEQLMVKTSEFPTREAAWEAIAKMGNQVLRGAPLDAVAKRESQGLKASTGGQYDWTSQGSLANETIDRVIFNLPVGELSPIIESSEGFHIVRVIDRKEAGMVPFTEAQVEIKEKIKNERSQEQMQAYIKEIKSKAQVWTIFDDEKKAETQPVSR